MFETKSRKQNGTGQQCEQIELFLRGLEDKILTKVAQIFGIFWGYLENRRFLSNFGNFFGDSCKNGEFLFQLLVTVLNNNILGKYVYEGTSE